MMKSAEISSLQRSEVQKPCEGYGWKTLGVWEDGSDVYTQTGEHCGTKDTSSKQENMTLPNWAGPDTLSEASRAKNGTGRG